ncbi:tetratricopeptide repeat protein [Tautonia sociabilis]|uniref:Tetratricopeptide repeat protein n=1 Tax=Tautonia sociabilis TaxID=2080755 RepID=A0A432MRZ1_9BACT|nr:tetratricopeptide repeat protein [Tautonia sociabilis]RUL89757.1 tetratricopeptide repeat protein [Tautonia sociabilis]
MSPSRPLSTRTVIACLGAVLFVAVPAPAWQPGRSPEGVQEPRPAKPEPPTDEPPPEDGGPIAFMYSTEQAVALFERRVAANPNDFQSLARLGQFRLLLAREGGGPECYTEAEAALRRALELNPKLSAAEGLLAAALNGQHRFAEGLEHARSAVEADPEDLNARAVLSDSLLELGRYDEAEAEVRRLYELAPVPEVEARCSRLAERRGRVDEAIGRMTRAAEAASASSVFPHADAWYRVQLADLLTSAGRLDEAEAVYAAIPEGIDAYHDATAGLARVKACRGETESAIQLYERAVALGPDPMMVVGLAELYRLVGREAEAGSLLRALEDELRSRPDERRHLALLYCDEGDRLPEALALARRDLEDRQDVDAFATLAWALHKNGRHAEAAEAIDRALGVGTRDALMHYRAGLIFEAAGDLDRSRALLREALAINPRFSPSLADDARRRLGADEAPK